MIHPFRLTRSEDDAPRDYSYVSSVNQGMRIQQSQNIHHKQSQPIVRHRAEPYARDSVDDYGTRQRRDAQPRSSYNSVMDKLPTLADGMPQGQSVAYPEDYGIPDNPFDQPRDMPRARRARPRQPVMDTGSQPGAQAAAPQASAAPQVQAVPQTQATPEPPAASAQDGPQFDPPASPDIPDWLRVAQQNNLPLRRPEVPRVRQAAAQPQPAEPTDLLGRPLRSRANVAAAMRQANPTPQTVDEYADAGYPEDLLHQQRQWEQQAAATPVRRRHGAQYAVRPQDTPQPAWQAASGTSYPPPRQAGESPRRRSVPSAQPQAAYWQQPGDFSAQPVYQQEPPAQMSRGYAAADAGQPDDGWQVEADETEAPAIRIPWLAILAVTALLAAIGLFTADVIFRKQTDSLLAARAAEQAAIEQNNPYSYRDLVEQKAKKYNLSPAFVAAIIRNESSFRPDATSSVGARGLMQLMEDTAQWIHDKMELENAYDFDALYDPETNVEFGCWYLNFLSERFRGDPVLVAAAFHAGQNQVQNWLNDSAYSQDHLTLEIDNMTDGPTKQYVTRVTRSFAIYKRLYYEATEDM